MKVALLTLDFPPGTGGVQRCLYEIAVRLAGRHEVVVITTAAGALPPDLPFQRIVLSAARVRLLAAALWKTGADRTLVGHAHPRLLLAAALCARRRYLCIAHGDDYLAAQQRWHRWFFNRLLAVAHPLITNSQGNADHLQELGLPRPQVVRPGTDPVHFTPAPRPVPGPPVLLTVARLVPRKGIDTTLRSVQSLLRDFPDVRYRVVGHGPDRSRLEHLAHELGVAHAVEFLGEASNRALPDIYRGADVFVMPVREERQDTSVEGFGLVYLEASACGLPVVAGQSGGALEAVRDGETGFLVVPDPGPVTEVLRRLLEDAELRYRMGAAGRRWVEREMNWERAIAEIERLLVRSPESSCQKQRPCA